LRSIVRATNFSRFFSVPKENADVFFNSTEIYYLVNQQTFEGIFYFYFFRIKTISTIERRFAGIFPLFR
jgi:hypothetical protein